MDIWNLSDSKKVREALCSQVFGRMCMHILGQCFDTLFYLPHFYDLAEDMIPEEKGPLLALVNQRQVDIAKIEQLETDVQHLKEIVESQHEILSKYDQTMIMLTNRNESYLTQVQELELSLANERKGRSTGGSFVAGDSTPPITMSPRNSANSSPKAL